MREYVVIDNGKEKKVTTSWLKAAQKAEQLRARDVLDVRIVGRDRA